MGQLKLLILVLFGFLAACSGASAPAGETSCRSEAAGDRVFLPAGRFVMGEDPREPEEGPPRQIEIEGFWIDRHEVTNAQFAEFVAQTGYVTAAERAAGPGNVSGSAVFSLPDGPGRPWWRWVEKAQWRHPSGPESGIAGKYLHPVVQVAFEDALAYARWKAGRLPTEAEWEYAARSGGREPLEDEAAHDQPAANVYQGVFPVRDVATDGYAGTAPVGCYPPNQSGLFDMIGNVWEWTQQDGDRADAIEPVKVIKGGSYLCAASYCARYRPAARQFQETGLATDHIGFRVVYDRAGDARGPSERQFR